MIHEMYRRLRDSDELRFFLHWLRRHGRVGAVVPSGTALAAALAAEIDSEAPGAVVELGPGTGRVTEALRRLRPLHLQVRTSRAMPPFVWF